MTRSIDEPSVHEHSTSSKTLGTPSSPVYDPPFLLGRFDGVYGELPAVCPDCGSDHIRTRPILKQAGLVAVLGAVVGVGAGYAEFAIIFVLMALGFAVFASTHICDDCDHRWSAKVSRPLVPPDEADLHREPTGACPRCKSEEIYGHLKRRLGGAVLLAAFSWTVVLMPLALISVFSAKQSFCRNCGLQW